MSKLIAINIAGFAVLVMLAFSSVTAAEDGCDDFGDYSYVCGPISAEDLVLVPGTKWVVASGFGGGASLYLVDSEQKTWRNLYPGDEPRALQNIRTYGACPGSPDPNGFVAHGLNIRAGADGHSTLYVVGHGEREAKQRPTGEGEARRRSHRVELRGLCASGQRGIRAACLGSARIHPGLALRR